MVKIYTYMYNSVFPSRRYVCTLYYNVLYITIYFITVYSNMRSEFEQKKFITPVIII